MNQNRKLEIENITIDILNKYRISNNPGKHLEEIINGENIKLVPNYEWPFEYCGRFIRKDNEVTIIYNGNHSKDIQAFTFAHELGHYFLKHFDDSDDETICLSRDLGGLDDDDENKPKEVEANFFAACLLLPSKWVKIEFIKFMDSINRSGIMFVDKQECNLIDYKKCIDHFRLHFLASETAIRYRLIGMNWMVFDKSYFTRKDRKLRSISELLQKIMVDLELRSEEYYRENF